MNRLLALTLVLMLTGCDPSYEEKTDSFKLPQELSDCKVYTLMNSSATAITVVRCPVSSVTTIYQSGKIRKSVNIT